MSSASPMHLDVDDGPGSTTSVHSDSVQQQQLASGSTKVPEQEQEQPVLVQRLLRTRTDSEFSHASDMVLSRTSTPETHSPGKQSKSGGSPPMDRELLLCPGPLPRGLKAKLNLGRSGPLSAADLAAVRSHYGGRMPRSEPSS